MLLWLSLSWLAGGVCRLGHRTYICAPLLLSWVWQVERAGSDVTIVGFSRTVAFALKVHAHRLVANGSAGLLP